MVPSLGGEKGEKGWDTAVSCHRRTHNLQLKKFHSFFRPQDSQPTAYEQARSPILVCTFHELQSTHFPGRFWVQAGIGPSAWWTCYLPGCPPVFPLVLRPAGLKRCPVTGGRWDTDERCHPSGGACGLLTNGVLTARREGRSGMSSPAAAGQAKSRTEPAPAGANR